MWAYVGTWVPKNLGALMPRPHKVAGGCLTVKTCLFPRWVNSAESGRSRSNAVGMEGVANPLETRSFTRVARVFDSY